MFLDTSVVLDMFRHDRDDETLSRILSTIGDETLYISIVQLAEIADFCIRHQRDPHMIVGDAREFANIVPIQEELCIQGAEIKHEMRSRGVRKFGLMDGIALASARSMGQKLLTRDKDFEKAEDAVVLP